MAIHIRVETGDVMRALRQLRKEDVPIVTAYALTKTAQDIKVAEVALMKGALDRPKPFTVNALFIVPATKRSLVALVSFKDPSGSATPVWKYLAAQVESGKRVHKSHERKLIKAGYMKPEEFAVPGKGVKVDSYGNMTLSTIERIVGQLQGSPKATMGRKRRSAAVRYSVIRPDGGARGKIVPGIYMHKGLHEIVPVIMFVRAPQYRKRLPWYETAHEVFKSRHVGHARDGFARFVTSRLKKAA